MTFSQSLDGIWRASHAQSIDSSDLVAVDPILELDTAESEPFVYTRFHKLDAILEIKGSNAALHDFKSKAKHKKIKIYNNSFYLKYKRQKINIEAYSGDSLLMKYKPEPNSFIVLYPFATSSDKIHSSDFINSSWQLSSTNDYFNDITFHFLDSGIVNIVRRNESYGSANPGEWKIFNSGSFYCLYVIDRKYIKENIFYLTSRESTKLLMLVSDQDFLEHPVQVEVKLEPVNKPKDTELNAISKTIIGKWAFESFYNHMDTIAFDSLINISYSIEFRSDHEYRLINHIKYIASYSTEVSEFSQEEIGNWVLSKTGDYLTLRPNGGWERNLALYSLNSTTVNFDLSYSYNDHSTFTSRIKMVKENRP